MIDERLYTDPDVQKAFQEIAAVTDTDVEYIRRGFQRIGDELTRLSNSLEKIAQQIPQEDIPYIRKAIKYCRNPLEKKALEKRLNAALKARGKRGYGSR